MSLGAWGDDDGAGDYDHLLEAGWWTPDDVEELREIVSALVAEPLYEGRGKEGGVSVRFLMRLTLLQEKAGVEVPRELVEEARRALEVPA